MPGTASRPVLRAFVRIVAVDSLTSAMLLVGWVNNHLGPPALIVGLGAARLLLTSLYLWRLLAPVKRWQDSPECDDATLLQVDDAIQGLFRRAFVVHVFGWIGCLSLPLAVRAFDPAAPLVPGERFFAVSLMCVGTIFNSAILFACFRQQCDAFMARLGPQLAERRLELVRTRHSLTREFVLVSMGFALSLMLSTGSSGFSVESKRMHEGLEAQLREQLLRQVVGEGVGVGVAPAALDEPGLDLRERDELEPALLARLEPGAGPGTLVSALDPRTGVVLAAYATSTGGWLHLARAPGDEMVGWLIGFLIYVGLTVGLVGLAMYWLTRALVDPLGRLDDASRRLAERGELGSLIRAAPVRDDEVGVLVDNFNHMLDMLTELGDASRAIAAGNLRVEVAHPGELHDGFRAMVRQLHQMVERIRSTALEVTSASAEIYATTTHQTGLAERNATELEDTGATIESLASAARTINELSSTIHDHAQASLSSVGHMSSRIEALGEQAEGIGELLEQIREIADRGDLLALNGSLEATRAGEAGRSFALVAAEMRRLSERITGVVADVRVRVTMIDDARAATVDATEDSRRLANLTAEVARRISQLSATQSDDSLRVSVAASTIADAVMVTATGLTQTAAAAEGLRVHVAELERLTQSFEASAGAR